MCPGWMGYWFIFLLYYSIQSFIYRTRGESFWSYSHSDLFKEDGSLNKPNLAVLALRNAITLFTTPAIYLLNKTAFDAGLSAAVVVSILGLNSFLTAILFFAVYRERIHKKQLLGMIIITLSPILIGMAAEYSPDNNSKSSEATGSAAWPVLVAVFLAIAIAFIGLVGRIAFKSGYKGLKYVIDSNASFSVILFVGYICFQLTL